MPRRADYTLILTNRSGTSMLCDPIGTSDPLAGELGWTKIEARPRHNQVGAGNFAIAARPDLMPALYTPDARVLVRRALDDGSGDTDVVMAGPVEIPDTGFEIKRDGTDGPGVVAVNFADDRVLVANRLLFPDPAHESNAQAVARYVLTNVNPELAMWNMVNLNLGPGAIVSRRQPGLTMRALQGIAPGVTVSKSFTRDWDLIESLREVDRLAKEEGGYALGVGFRIVQNGAAGVQFQTFAPQDLSAKVVFARMLGNVTAGSYSRTAPTVTHAITGNADAGTARIISERVNAAAVAEGWNRREVFVDARSAPNLTEQNKLGDKALSEGGPKARAQVTALETADCRYDYDFGPGDLVSYLPYPGGPYVTATCLGADITVTENGEDIVPVIGTDDQGINADAKAAEFRKIWAELRRMQGAL